MSEIVKKATFKIEGEKLIAKASGGLSFDTDNDGQPVAAGSVEVKLEIDPVEAISEFSKSTNSELLKKILPFAEIIVKNALAAASQPSQP